MRYIFFVLAFCVLGCASAFGDEGSDFAEATSDALYPLIGYALYDTLRSDDATEHETGRRLVDALAITGAVTLLGKKVITSRRPAPNSDETDGMPSGHSALAFATAAVLAERDAANAAVVYGLAGLVAWSRGETKQHQTDQIVAGSALGYLIGRQVSLGEWHIYSDGDAGVLSVRAGGTFGCGRGLGAEVIYHTDF